MSTTDFVLTQNAGKARIHRAACKRAANPNALQGLDPKRLVGATPASCCKPSAKAVEAAITEIATAAYQHEIVETSDGLAVLPYASTGIAKHYWPVLCKGGALSVGAAHGLVVKATNAEARLVGTPEALAAAKADLDTLWGDGYAAFNEWRRTDPGYLATKAADKGVPWGKSQKRVAELAWLRSLVDG